MRRTSSSTAVECGTGSVNHVRTPGLDVSAPLARQRRRHVVSCLRNYDDPITLADLADEVAVMENGTPLTEIPAQAVKRVYMSLYHSHVPTLEDAAIVEYTQDGDLVELSTPVAESPEGMV